MILGHVIALDPTYKQANAMARAAGCARFAYNWGLAEWERQYKAGMRPNASAIKKAFNAIKLEAFPWIYESPKDANQQAFADLGRAFANFFRWQKDRKGPKVGYPSRRRKGVDDAFYVANDKFHFDAKRDVVRLPVIGDVRLHERLRLTGRILSARVSRRAGRWYLAVQVDVVEARRPIAHVRPVVGVDLGIKTALVLSNGETFAAPKPLKSSLAALCRANRTLHRRKKGSHNRRKAAARVARIHARVANVRKDFMHKVTTRLCRENQAVVIEDLNVRGMVRNHCLARAIADVGFGMFRQFMTYKGPIYGSELIVADRWFPSSKRCHACGNVKESLSLSERTHTCDACGVIVDRDENAALNLEMYPRLAGNTVVRPDAYGDVASTAWVRPPRKRVGEVGTKPCVDLRTN